ncbi:MAG: NADH-quinone oxidoreductase subunit B [Oscillospiraceae bacterium]|nr:NADH-quinone oxidoreductase subunit B [Oscillospiraceae bacterium]
MLRKLVERSQIKSPWVFHLRTGSCSGCDVEIKSILGSKFDVEKYGIKFINNPNQANIILVTGCITLNSKSKDRVLDILTKIPDPKAIIAVGTCSLSCGVFSDSYAVEGPLSRWINVDINLAGCPPKPNAILESILEAGNLLNKRREELVK